MEKEQPKRSYRRQLRRSAPRRCNQHEVSGVIQVTGSVQVRDTKEVRAGYTEEDRIVCFTKQQWQRWVLEPIRRDEIPPLFVKMPNGNYVFCNPVLLSYTQSEVDAFVAGAKMGEFELPTATKTGKG